MARYRIRTADGQAFDVEGMGAIRRHHPDATITHEIAFDPLGQAVLRPYTGEQPDARESRDEPALDPAREDAPESGETPKRARKG